jgi:hypothetical protein
MFFFFASKKMGCVSAKKYVSGVFVNVSFSAVKMFVVSFIFYSVHIFFNRCCFSL